MAQHHILVDIINGGNCSTLMGLTLQLPRNARVKEISMDLSDGCSMSSTVKTEENAKEDFAVMAQQGNPAALLQAYDLENYALQVSLPPFGATRVELTAEELLVRKRGRIDFSIPLFPGLSVEELVMNVMVQEHVNGITAFDFIEQNDSGDMSSILVQSWDVGGSNDTVNDASAQLQAFFVSDDGRMSDEVVLPRLLRGFYDSGPIHENGLIIPDSTGNCFVHLFNPSQSLLSSAGSLPRNIVFALDVSGSMEGHKLRVVQVAFGHIIDRLTDRDYFAIHSFSDEGTQDFFGPTAAHQAEKDLAKAWVGTLQAYGSTNLGDAYMDAIQRVQDMQLAAYQRDDINHGINANTSYVSVVMVLTDGQASSGVTDLVEISRRIKRANTNNKEGVASAKIYSFAFGTGADYPTLAAISMQNQGLALQVYEGFGDASTQIESFFEGELGTILASDVNVFFDGTVKVESQTQTRFAAFPDGSEIAVRAKTRDDSRIKDGSVLRATTIGHTAKGLQSWRAMLPVGVANNNNTQHVENTANSECTQSFAHAKITELMQFREAALSSIGMELIGYSGYYLMQNGVAWNTASEFGRNQRRPQGGGKRRSLEGPDYDLAGAAEAQAVQLALEAGLVWPGLTAMVTVPSPSCAAFNDPTTRMEVCFEGDSIDRVPISDSGLEEGDPPTLRSSTQSFTSIGFWYSLAASVLLVWIL